MLARNQGSATMNPPGVAGSAGGIRGPSPGADVEASEAHADATPPLRQPNVERRPILRRLVSFPRVRGDCVGAFAEFSGDLHALLEETASAACDRHWRTAGARSASAARSVFTTIYRRRWGCEAALQGARMRLSRGYLVGGRGAADASQLLLLDYFAQPSQRLVATVGGTGAGPAAAASSAASSYSDEVSVAAWEDAERLAFWGGVPQVAATPGDVAVFGPLAEHGTPLLVVVAVVACGMAALLLSWLRRGVGEEKRRAHGIY